MTQTPCLGSGLHQSGTGCVTGNPNISGCGTQGKPGCGGRPGGGGPGGHGGGSSIAVFAWDATVDIGGGAIIAGNGGKGSLGGTGGDGGEGGNGVAGVDMGCNVSCNLGTCTAGHGVSTGGLAGSNGGKGGKGGAGGGGAGGFSYAIYRGGIAAVTTTGTTLMHGDPGTSASDGDPGSSADSNTSQ